MKKKKLKKILTGAICAILAFIMVVSMFLPAVVAEAAEKTIIYMDNNKGSYEIGEKIKFGVRAPGASSFDFTMGYNSSCLKMEKEYEGNRVHVEGEYFFINAEVIGNGKLYFKVTNVSANNGVTYLNSSILRYAGNGQEQEEQEVPECLLSELKVDDYSLSPEFDKYVDIYWIETGEDQDVSISAVPEKEGDSITIKKDGEEIADATQVHLEKELETFDVVVSSGGENKTYTLFIKCNIKEVEEPPQEEVEKPNEDEKDEKDEKPVTPDDEEKEKKSYFNPIAALIVMISGFAVVAVLILNQIKKSRKEYESSDEAYRKNENKERQKRIEQRRKEKLGITDEAEVEEKSKKGLFKKKK